MSDVAIPHDIEPHPMTGMYNGKLGLWLFLASEIMLFGALFSTYVVLRVGAPEGTWPRHGSEILNVPLATLNTMVLISSSVTMVLAWAYCKMNQFDKGRLFLLATFLLAGTFMVVKYFEYSEKFHHYAVVLKEPIKIGHEDVTRISGHLDHDTHLEVNPVNGAFVVPESLRLEPDPKKGSSEHPPAIEIPGDNIRRITNFGPSHSTYLATYFTLTGLHGLHIVGGMVVILYFILTGKGFFAKMPEKFCNRIECTGLYWHFVDLVWIFLFPVLYLL